MKKLLLLFFNFSFVLFGWAQNDSIHANLKAHHCNYFNDHEGYKSFDSTFLTNNDPVNDTLELFSEDGIKLADYWLDESRVWCRLNELQEAEIDLLPQLYYGVFNYGEENYNKWLLFYDFEELDTLTVEDTVTQTTSPFGIPNSVLKINAIDTVLFFGEQKKVYHFNSFDILVKGYGSLVHPLGPLLEPGSFSFCNCGIDFEFFDGTDTTSFYYTPSMINKSCADPATISTDSYEKESQLKVYPNPYYGNELYLESDKNIIIESIKMTNTLGQSVPINFKQDLNNKTSLFIDNIPSGMYFIEVTSDSKKARLKIIVEN